LKVNKLKCVIAEIDKIYANIDSIYKKIKQFIFIISYFHANFSKYKIRFEKLELFQNNYSMLFIPMIKVYEIIIIMAQNVLFRYIFPKHVILNGDPKSIIITIISVQNNDDFFTILINFILLRAYLGVRRDLKVKRLFYADYIHNN
jgi:hypothetical protein